MNEPLESESFKVEKIILHPNFRYMLTQPDRYDIALLKLDRPVVRNGTSASVMTFTMFLAGLL